MTLLRPLEHNVAKGKAGENFNAAAKRKARKETGTFQGSEKGSKNVILKESSTSSKKGYVESQDPSKGGEQHGRAGKIKRGLSSDKPRERKTEIYSIAKTQDKKKRSEKGRGGSNFTWGQGMRGSTTSAVRGEKKRHKHSKTL